MSNEKMSADEVLAVLSRRAAECRTEAILAAKHTERPHVAEGWYESEAETLEARAYVAALIAELDALREDAEAFRFLAAHCAAWHHDAATLPRIVIEPRFLDADGNTCSLIVTGRDGVGTVSLRQMVEIIKKANAAAGISNLQGVE